MDDVLRRPVATAALFAALLWMVAFACYVMPDLASGSDQLRPRYLSYLALCSAVGFMLSVAVFGALQRTMRMQGAARIALSCGAVLGGLIVHAAIDQLTFTAIVRARIVVGAGAPVSAQTLLFVNNTLLLAPVHITFAVTALLGFSLRAIGDRERRLSAALQAAQEAQLAALRFQINPHFLFNSLNAVTALIAAHRNAEAEQVVTRLAAFFRASLGQAPVASVSLAEEFDMLAAYLDIESVRLGERLDVTIDLPRDLARAMLPPFLLQPLVENAIKHAVMPSARPVRLTIRARRVGATLVLEVADGGRGGQDGGTSGANARPGAGVGLANVRARLAALHGGDARLETHGGPDGFTARITLPFPLQRKAA